MGPRPDNRGYACPPVTLAIKGRLPLTSKKTALAPWLFGITMVTCLVLPGGCVMRILSLKLPPSLSVKLERAAKQRGQSKSAIVRTALEQYLNGERPLSALELAGDLVGCAEGPEDLSTNPKYMEGYGK
jgi:hypothetical protein